MACHLRSRELMRRCLLHPLDYRRDRRQVRLGMEDLHRRTSIRLDLRRRRASNSSRCLLDLTTMRRLRNSRVRLAMVGDDERIERVIMDMPIGYDLAKKAL